MTKILAVDDEPRILLLLKSLLGANGYAVETAQNGTAALEKVRQGDVDIVVTDLRMSPIDGLQLFNEIHALKPELPVILLTAYASVETAIAAMKSGMFDYLTKPFRVDELLGCLKRATENLAKNQSLATTIGDEQPSKYRFEGLIASSAQMLQVCEMLQKVAPTAATVLINGESGTGKEVVAKTIHRLSSRKDRPWVAVNCAALPEQLLESEMFGHVKGAFTGAYADKQGLFEVADGGTLFLDEISSMPLLLQGKLLRVLQEQEIRRVGGTKDLKVNVRVIAASNADLEAAVVAGRFRNDLYYRLAVIKVDIPPIRERKDDILPLSRHFIAAEALAAGRSDTPRLAEDAVRALTDYDWPGNVRELENAIRHAMTFLQDGNEITANLLPQKVHEHRALPTAPRAFASQDTSESLKSYIRQKEREYIQRILNANGGDKSKAAETLKVNLSTLYRKLSEE